MHRSYAPREVAHDLVAIHKLDIEMLFLCPFEQVLVTSLYLAMMHAVPLSINLWIFFCYPKGSMSPFWEEHMRPRNPVACGWVGILAIMNGLVRFGQVNQV